MTDEHDPFHSSYTTSHNDGEDHSLQAPAMASGMTLDPTTMTTSGPDPNEDDEEAQDMDEEDVDAFVQEQHVQMDQIQQDLDVAVDHYKAHVQTLFQAFSNYAAELEAVQAEWRPVCQAERAERDRLDWLEQEVSGATANVLPPQMAEQESS